MQSFHTQQAADNTLSEYRISRVQQLEGEIKQQYANLANAALALGVALKSFKDEKLWQVDGYQSMTHYVSVRWPQLSKPRLSQILASATAYEEVEAHNEAAKVNNLLTPVPSLQNEGQARALAAIPSEERIPTLQLSAEQNDGQAPTAQQITETHQALTGERIGRIDASPHHKTNFTLNEDGTPNQQTGGENYIKAEEGRSLPAKRPFGYVPPESVCTDYVHKKLILSFVRPGVPATGLKEYKAQGLTIAWYVLEAQGWTPPNQQYKEDLEEFNDSRNPFIGKAQETDEPESFAPDNAQDYDPPNMAIEAMNKLFDDEFSQ